MSEQNPAGVVQSVYDAFGRGDIASLLDKIDPQAEVVFEGPPTIPWAGNRRGRDAWAKFFQTVAENLDDVTLTMAVFAAQGDHIVAAGRYQGRVKKTGKRIDSPLVHLWTIRSAMV